MHGLFRKDFGAFILICNVNADIFLGGLNLVLGYEVSFQQLDARGINPSIEKYEGLL